MDNVPTVTDVEKDPVVGSTLQPLHSLIQKLLRLPNPACSQPLDARSSCHVAVREREGQRRMNTGQILAELKLIRKIKLKPKA